MKLVPIPKESYKNYRLNVIFSGYKWDPQFGDNNTIAPYALVLDKNEADEVINLTNKLTQETIEAQKFLSLNINLAKQLKLPKKILKGLKSVNLSNVNSLNLMRFDFHALVGGGWAISEVNSDVPGGFAESSLMAQFANETLDNKYDYIDFGEKLCQAVMSNALNNKIALIHCTSYSDDRQVMQYLADKLEKRGYEPILAAADHLRFKNGRTFSILDGHEGEVGAIVRFTPIEWITPLKKCWRGYFLTQTPSSNHPIAFFTQTKRFPFVFDVLQSHGVSLKTWRTLLPNTVRVKNIKGLIDDGYILKPVFGRVGEDIAILDAISTKEYDKILSKARIFPNKFVAQKMFNSLSVDGFHICLGAFSVMGKFSGFYARMSASKRIDSAAADLPVLIN